MEVMTARPAAPDAPRNSRRFMRPMLLPDGMDGNHYCEFTRSGYLPASRSRMVPCPAEVRHQAHFWHRRPDGWSGKRGTIRISRGKSSCHLKGAASDLSRFNSRMHPIKRLWLSMITTAFFLPGFPLFAQTHTHA